MKYIEKIFEYTLALFIVLECNSVYSRCDETKYYILIALAGSILALIIINYIKHKQVNINRKMYVYIIAYFVYIGIYMLYTKTLDIKFIYLFVVCLPLLVLLYLFDKDNAKTILKSMTNVIMVLCIVSFVFWILGPILNVLQPSGNMIIDWGEIRTIPSYYNLHFITQRAGIFKWFLVRNTGIFAEAPMYSLVLMIGLITNLFISTKKSIIKTVLLFLGILSTISTTGIIISCIVIGCSYILKEKKSKNQILFIVISILVILLVATISVIFMRDKLSSMSYRIRIDDYIASFKAWKDNVLFGNGFDNEQAIRIYMSEFRQQNLGLSNSLLTLLALGGIYLFSIYLIPLIVTIKKYIKSNKRIVFYTFMILLLFALLIFHYKVLIINFLAIGYSYILNNKVQKTNGDGVHE